MRRRKRRVLILSNNSGGIYRLRGELIKELCRNDYNVFVSVPDETLKRELENIKAHVIINSYLLRRGTNPIQDIQLAVYYHSLIKKIVPDIVLTYTIKPNVYGGMICEKLHIPCIANITGLGTSVENKGALKFLALMLYKIGLKGDYKIFFQNSDNRSYMVFRNIVKNNKTILIPGSGVNTSIHSYERYPNDSNGIIFLIIGRIMRDKGIHELLDAALKIKETHKNVVFRFIGDFDENYQDMIEKYDQEKIIEYMGEKYDVHPYIASCHALIHASYHEGMSNVLQEAASTGRPVIATDVHGCIETFEPGVTGIAFKAKNTNSLVEAIEMFLSMDNSEREAMGRKGREKMIREFDRRIVVDRYMREIRKAGKKENV